MGGFSQACSTVRPSWLSLCCQWTHTHTVHMCSVTQYLDSFPRGPRVSSCARLTRCTSFSMLSSRQLKTPAVSPRDASWLFDVSCRDLSVVRGPHSQAGEHVGISDRVSYSETFAHQGSKPAAADQYPESCWSCGLAADSGSLSVVFHLGPL